MPITQRKFREIVFQMIYSQDLNSDSWLEEIPFLFDQLVFTKKGIREAKQRMQKIFECLDKIDQLIVKSVPGYDFERISRVEKNILRLGVYELLFDEKIPPKVAIAEAIRICRKFGSPEGANFVNGVLDFLYSAPQEGETRHEYCVTV